MAPDEALAARVRDGLVGTPGIDEKKMFGGICWMLRGNMLVGLTGKSDFMARVGPDAHPAALKLPGARPMDFGGRPMVGMVFVGPAGVKKPADLQAWIDRSMAFVRTLPAKVAKAPKAAKVGKPAVSKKKQPARKR